MSDFDSFLKEQLEQEGVRREYYRLDPFYRLADQLVLLRKQRGLTQKELAEKAGTTQAVISRLENVSVRASLETVVRLAEALDAVVELKLEPMEEMQAASEDNAQEKPVEKPCNEEKAVDVSEPEARYRIQCTEIRLVSSELRPLDPKKEKQGESRFTFKIKVGVQGNMAYGQLQTQVVFVSSEEGEPLRGCWLRFILVGTFAGDEGISPEELGEFARIYTLSISWPYAREYTSDQFRRTGEPFDSLPVINPQVLTEAILDAGLVEVVIHADELDPGSE